MLYHHFTQGFLDGLARMLRVPIFMDDDLEYVADALLVQEIEEKFHVLASKTAPRALSLGLWRDAARDCHVCEADKFEDFVKLRHPEGFVEELLFDLIRKPLVVKEYLDVFVPPSVSIG